jgi:hypothetical protein
MLAAALTVAGCGSTTSSSTSTSGSSAPNPAQSAGLNRFLVRSGEEPGFTPRSPQVSGSVNAWVSGGGEPPQQATADTKRYKAEGFVTAAIEHTTPNGRGDGVSNVIEFATAAGARHEMTYLLQLPGSLTTFTVPGIPNAGGTKGNNGQGGSDANLVWVQGRCTLLIGESVPNSVAPTQSLIAGAKAVYRRTSGTCP